MFLGIKTAGDYRGLKVIVLGAAPPYPPPIPLATLGDDRLNLVVVQFVLA